MSGNTKDQASPEDDSSDSTSTSNSADCAPPPPQQGHKRRAGRKKFRETRHPVYRGVRERNGGKWVCEVREPQKKTRIWLGTYLTPEMAARAHDVAAIALRGKSAPLNFADSAWLLPRARTPCAEDVRAAAAQAAEMFRPAAARGCAGAAERCRPAARREGSRAAAAEAAAPAQPEGFVDEEELFNMPEVLRSMAEGLLLSPPTMPEDEAGWEDGGLEGICSMDFSLWND